MSIASLFQFVFGAVFVFIVLVALGLIESKYINENPWVRPAMYIIGLLLMTISLLYRTGLLS